MRIRRTITVTLILGTLAALALGSRPALADKPMPVAPPPKRARPTPAEVAQAASQAAAAAASAAAAAGKAAAAAGTSAAAAGKAAAAAGAQVASAAAAAAGSAVKAAGSPAPAGSAASPTAAPTTGGALTQEELARRIADRDKTRDARRQVERDRLRIRWGSLVDTPAAHDELKNHATRVARLERIQELAQVAGKTAIATRASKALDRESLRHDKAMAALAAAPPAPAPSSTGGAK